MNICFYTYYYITNTELNDLENKTDINKINNIEKNDKSKDEDNYHDNDKEFELIMSKNKNKGYKKLDNEDKEL
jgi:hypothetical protein